MTPLAEPEAEIVNFSLTIFFLQMSYEPATNQVTSKEGFSYLVGFIYLINDQ